MFFIYFYIMFSKGEKGSFGEDEGEKDVKFKGKSSEVEYEA